MPARIGRPLGAAAYQDTTGAANPAATGSYATNLRPTDPGFTAQQVARSGSPLLRGPGSRPNTSTPVTFAPGMQGGSGPMAQVYEQNQHAGQVRAAGVAGEQWAQAIRNKAVNGGNGLYAFGPNGHALGAGSNVGQNGFGAFSGMPGAGQVSNANRDANGGGAMYGPVWGGGLRGGSFGGSGGYGGAGGSVGQALQGSINSANSANQQRYNQLLGLTDQLSNAQMTREGLRRNDQLGRVNQEMVTSGLAGTTVMPNLERGVYDDSALRENEISDQGIRTKMGIIERRTDQPPDLGLVAGLATRPGASGGFGGFVGGYGPMSGAPVSRGHGPTTGISQPGQQSDPNAGVTENQRMSAWLARQRAINSRVKDRNQQLAGIQRGVGGALAGTAENQAAVDAELAAAGYGNMEWAGGNLDGYGPLADPLLYNPDFYA